MAFLYELLIYIQEISTQSGEAVGKTAAKTVYCTVLLLVAHATHLLP